MFLLVSPGILLPKGKRHSNNGSNVIIIIITITILITILIMILMKGYNKNFILLTQVFQVMCKLFHVDDPINEILF